MSDDQYSSDPETPPKESKTPPKENPSISNIGSLLENESDRGSLDDSGDDLTEEQNELLTRLLQVCSDESIDTCKKTLKRHNFNVDSAALELLMPSSTPQSNSATNFPSLSSRAVPTDIPRPQSMDDIVRAQPISSQNSLNESTDSNFSVLQQSENQNIVRQRRNVMSSAQTQSSTSRPRTNGQSYANIARRANRQSILDRLPIATTWILAQILKIVQMPVIALCRLATTVLPESISRPVSNLLLPSARATNGGQAWTIPMNASSISRSDLSPRQEVANSVELLKKDFPIYENINFFQGDYNEALSKCKSQVKYLLVYLHVPEHQETKNFLNDSYENIKKFQETDTDNALVWTCRLDSREGAFVASELFISVFPCLALLAPVSSARVSCINQIYEAKDFDQLLKSKDDFSGELVVLLEEKRKRESDVRLRKEQEQEYEQATLRDAQNMSKKLEEERKVEMKKQEIQDKKDDLASAKAEALKLIESEVDSQASNSTSSAAATCKVMVRMPDGKRLEKVFGQDLEIRHIRAFILCDEQISSLEFGIQSQFPNKTYANDQEKISTAFNNAKSQLLFIKSAKDESIEENSSSETESESESSTEEEDSE